MKKILLAAFILTVVAQLYVPAKMILGREEILSEGKEFRFKTAPIDPNDPFRGKYITLGYQDTEFPLKDTTEVWQHGQEVFVALDKNEEGYAIIKGVMKERPEESEDFVSAIVWGYWDDRIVVRYSFDRFYMDEYKAPRAETAYREAMVDSTQVAYAVVRVKNGEAVVADVMIDGESIKEIVLKESIE